MATNIRPGWLTAIGVLAIVLGSLGILGSIYGVLAQLYSAAWQERMQEMVISWQRSGGLPTEALEMQKELQQVIIGVQLRWRTTMLVMCAVSFAISLLLLAGGIGALRLATWGRKLLIAALATTMVYQVVAVIPGLIIQQETMQVTQEYTHKMIRAAQQAQPNSAATPLPMQPLNIATSVGFMVGLVMTVGWVLVKLLLYAAAIYYLRTPLIRAIFANQQGPAEVQAAE